MSAEVFIALGTNLGDKQANLQSAIIKMQPQVMPITLSPVYETPPWGVLNQPTFLNQVIFAQTDLLPEALLEFLKECEIALGRIPTILYGPRLIDLDILFYENLVFETDRLSIPHPHLAERAFVLAPLADLAPELVHPINGKTILEMLAQVDCSDISRLDMQFSIQESKGDLK